MKTWTQVVAGIVLFVAGCVAAITIRSQGILPGPLPQPIPDDPLRVLPSKVEVEPGRMFKLQAKTSQPVTWVVPPASADKVQIEPLGQALLLVAPEGEYQLGVTWADKDRAAEVVWCKVVAGKGPRPPPDPKPDPIQPAPIPVAGFRVLILYESSSQLPPKQGVILNATAVKSYLDQTCVKDKDGNPEWRIFDKDVFGPGYKDSEVWSLAAKRPRSSLPWVIISNHPHGGYEGLLPGSVDEMMSLLKKIGG